MNFITVSSILYLTSHRLQFKNLEFYYKKTSSFGSYPVWQAPTTVWPSGLRRWLQAPVRKGVGSNPTGVSFFGNLGNIHLEHLVCWDRTCTQCLKLCRAMTTVFLTLMYITFCKIASSLCYLAHISLEIKDTCCWLFVYGSNAWSGCSTVHSDRSKLKPKCQEKNENFECVK